MSRLWAGEGPMPQRRSDRVQGSIIIAILLLLEFYLRPSLVEGKGMPDFLLLTLLLLAVRSAPGPAAVIGLVVGLVIDVLTPARFGANILAHVLIGCGAALGRAVVFADSLVVYAGLFFTGALVRNLLALAVSGASLAPIGAEALVWAPLQGLSTALVGVTVVFLFRDWLAIRIE